MKPEYIFVATDLRGCDSWVQYASAVLSLGVPLTTCCYNSSFCMGVCLACQATCKVSQHVAFMHMTIMSKNYNVTE